MDTTKFFIVKLSESFSDLWSQLGSDLGAECLMVEDEAPTGRTRETAAVILAAGGEEQRALNWLESHERPANVPLFVVGAETGRRAATKIVARGASDYFALPEDIEILRNSLATTLSQHQERLRKFKAEHERPREEAFEEIIGESWPLKELLSRAARILKHPSTTVLIVGETGTGKELLARAIHYGGPRRGAPFVPVNCSALPDHLIESELFGHEEGAFTDARATKPGLFEVADGGTLFLDEIGTLPVELQAKLLRVLQERQIRRVGGTKLRDIDVRIIAATNEQMDSALKEGRFREDLYFRLSVITLTLPPLRHRGDDVILIAEALLSRLAAEHDLPTPILGTEARRALMSHAWPGNVRELRNAIERALLLSTGPEIDPQELVTEADPVRHSGGPIPFPALLDDITSAAARATVEMCEGNRSEAARRLGISRRRLRRLIDGPGTDDLN